MAKLIHLVKAGLQGSTWHSLQFSLPDNPYFLLEICCLCVTWAMPDVTLLYHLKSSLILWCVGWFLGTILHQLLKQPERTVTFWSHLLHCHFWSLLCAASLWWCVMLFAGAPASLCWAETRMWRQSSACAAQRRWLPGLGPFGFAERSCCCALWSHAPLGECMPALVSDVTVTLC